MTNISSRKVSKDEDEYEESFSEEDLDEVERKFKAGMHSLSAASLALFLGLPLPVVKTPLEPKINKAKSFKKLIVSARSKTKR